MRTQDSFVSEMKEEGKMKKLSIHLKEVSIHFSGKPILEIDELFVYENEKIGIIGKNGAGKSTLLNLIMVLINMVNIMLSE